MKLEDLFDLNQLADHLEAGNIRAQKHPTEPLAIYCYTQNAQHRHAWDDVTRACRGLIVNAVTGDVVARPPGKFFNLGEHQEGSYAGPLNLVPPITVYDKVDGSAAISFRRPSDGMMQFATKGSFASEQAQWANAWLERHCPGGVEADESTTLFAEIIYPSNRIVLNYGDMEGLVLLAAIDIESGRQLDEETFWPFGPNVETFGQLTDPAGIAHLESRADREGYVLLSADLKTRVKVKEAEYVRLHALLTECTERTIWEYLRTGTTLDRLYDTVPDEFSEWLNGVVKRLNDEYQAIDLKARTTYSDIMFELVMTNQLDVDSDQDTRTQVAGDRNLRREFAALATKTDDPGLMFALLDRQEDRFKTHIWALLRPEAARPFTNDPDLIETP